MTYESFRVLISPNVANPGTWSVEVRECPIPGLVGSSDVVAPMFTRDELRRLRNAALWPDANLLKAIGGKVWSSVMAPNVRAAYYASLNALQADKGLRVVFVVSGGQGNGEAAGPAVRLAEVPVEVLFENAFVASNLKTPVSRSLVVSPTYESRQTPLPLRILVVIATPIDLPAAKIEDEQKVIRDALATLVDGGTVHVEYCTHATKRQFGDLIASKKFHIVHFIGHGSFDTAADDTTPVPYICFEREDTHENDPMNADTLRMHLLNSEVRLVVLTSCSSSAPAPPDQEPYVHRAYDGIAQSLVGGVSGIPAVVAMQFDLSSAAAVEFSKTFYDFLLRQNVSLDEAVTKARIAVATKLGSGHPAWVTPTVYWNCTGVPLFDLAPTKIDPEAEKDLANIETQINTYRGIVQMMAGRPAEEQQALAVIRQSVLAKIHDLEDQRGLIIGDSLRLWGGTVKRGDTIELKLELRLRLAAVIGNVDFKVRFAADKLTFRGAAPAPNGMPIAIADNGAGELRVVIPNASEGAQWAPGRHDLTSLEFEIGATAETITSPQMAEANVQRDGVGCPFATLSPVVFVE